MVMRFAYLSALLCLRLLAQERFEIILSAPAEPGDRFEVFAASNDFELALIKPNGTRVTSANASAEGFGWYERIPGGSVAGEAIIVSFKRPALAGGYILEFSPASKNSQSKIPRVSASFERVSSRWFNSPRFPGSAVIGMAVPASETMTLTVPEHPGPGLIDILASDPATEFAVTVPSGRTITAESATAEALVWKTTTDLSSEPVQVAGFLFPHPGRHHLIYLAPAQAGTYSVRGIGPSAQGEFRTMFLPLDEDAGKHLALPQTPTPLIVQPRPMPDEPGPCRVWLVSARVPGGPTREGRVVLHARIDQQGRAHDVNVIRSAGAVLDRDAIEYVEHCGKYDPNQVSATIEVNFRTL